MASPPLQSVTVISVPYHVGCRDHGPGAGPGFLLERGLLESLRELGVAVHTAEVEPVDDFVGEIGRSFEVIRRVSTLVSQAHGAGSFPIVLSGNCNAGVGSPRGFSGKLGCVWFDAHDDYNTPDTVLSGYFDSQGIAMMAGECWQALMGTVPGHSPVDVRDKLVHVAMRDVNELERKRVLDGGFGVVWGDPNDQVDFAEQLDGKLCERALGDTMVHVDLDCLDVSVGRANQFAVPGGLSEKDLHGCLDAIMAHTRPISLTLASFDPVYEGADNIAAVGIGAAKKLLGDLLASEVLSRKSE
ncbi:hypothetical protein BX600DRAFT_434567 [Xylariales sp. PMI_506]|nr:hypothetical protein BX600DRAFT_434567 [Xylariales sp. PMI_506]